MKKVQEVVEEGDKVRVMEVEEVEEVMEEEE